MPTWWSRMATEVASCLPVVTAAVQLLKTALGKMTMKPFKPSVAPYDCRFVRTTDGQFRCLRTVGPFPPYEGCASSAIRRAAAERTTEGMPAPERTAVTALVERAIEIVRCRTKERRGAAQLDETRPAPTARLSFLRAREHLQHYGAQDVGRVAFKAAMERKSVRESTTRGLIDERFPKQHLVPAFRIQIREFARAETVVIGKLVAGESSPFGIGVLEKIDRQNGSIVMRKMIGSVNVMQSNSAGSHHPVCLQKNTAQHLSRDMFEHRIRNLDVNALIGKVTVCRVGRRSIFDLCMQQ